MTTGNYLTYIITIYEVALVSDESCAANSH